jgi:hypothetical protein
MRAPARSFLHDKRLLVVEGAIMGALQTPGIEAGIAVDRAISPNGNSPVSAARRPMHGLIPARLFPAIIV